jgi:uncharacterized membrane protein
MILMHEFVVVTFPDAATSRDGSDAIRKLHAKGRLKIYAAVLVARDPNGRVSIQHVTKRGHRTTAAGAFIGALAGLPFGPLAIAIGAGAGALLGHSAELLHEDDAAKFVREVSRDLSLGKTMVVAEIAEDGLIPFMGLMERLGGTVLRK